ncbi:MAG: acyl-CoA dehydratase activase-related protein, partial [Clostridia bacterium]|nr:acyl-CoA dehydratase activase-related protein [Clostridia bacterium]
MVNTLYPLYAGFFTALGYEVVYSSQYSAEGCSRRGAAFCWPIEQAHGTFKELLELKPDILFLPHVKALPVPGGEDVRVACPFVQAEPYLLKAAFPEASAIRIFEPVLDMTLGYDRAEEAFTEVAINLGHARKAAQEAFQKGLEAQNSFHRALREEGRRVLKSIEESPDETAIVLFGRPYNAFSSLGNMGIPKKLASRGYRIIPQDFLPVDEEDTHDNMYWASGQWILKAARFVARHPKLFGAYVTNFSCGPDSFLVSYFRTIMGRKPSLTLELDSHTADAGVDTRIEAFIDVVKRYREMERLGLLAAQAKDGVGASKVETSGSKAYVVTSDGRRYDLSDPRVKVLVPSMGEIGARMLAATLNYVGAHAVPLPPPGEAELSLGRGFASCKECLPLILTFGSLMRYVNNEWNGEDILVNFMPETSGPCRFGQYNVMMLELVGKQKLDKVAMLSLTSENSYAGFGVKFALRAWHSIVLSDVLDDIHSAVMALAKHPEEAEKRFKEIADGLVDSVGKDPWP